MMNPLRLAALATALVTSTVSAQPASPYAPPPPTTPAMRPPPVSMPTPSTQSDSGVTGTLVGPSGGGFAPPPAPGYYPPVNYIQSPLNGYLSGVAEVTTANGQYLSQVQQARLLQTQADMSKLDLRRRIVEQQRYLRSLEPSPEEIRQKEIADAIARSRNNPPPTEIWSGKALNDLLIAIQRAQRGGATGPSVPLDPSMLSRINLTTGATTAGAGLLKDLRRFNWPLPLLDDPFNENRTQIESLARQAADQAGSGMVDARLTRDLQKSISDMVAAVKARVGDFTPTQYVQATRYLRELNNSTRVLQDPNVASYFSDKFRATGSTVAELIQGLNNRGLLFAPAAPGDEPAYTALHGALVTYDYGLHQVAAR
jgi:hypothetical protein